MTNFIDVPVAPVLGLLADAGAKGALVMAAASVTVWALRRRPAATRHAVWATALAMQLVLVILTPVLPAWHLPLLPSPAAVAPGAVSDAGVTGAPRGRSTPSAPVPVIVTSAAPNTLSSSLTAPSPGTIVLGLWLLGCGAILLRLAAGSIAVARMARAGERVTDARWLAIVSRAAQALGIRRPLTLMRSERAGVAVTWGVVRPVVLLPRDANEWSQDRRHCVLMHEMAHVQRLDAATQFAAQIALALFWFDPLIWHATRLLRREREHACDDVVLRHGAKASAYASDLLEIVRSLTTGRERASEPAFAALAMARRSEFEGRMLSILDPAVDRHPLSHRGTLMSIATAFVIALPLAAFSPFRVQAPAAAAPAATSPAAPSSPAAVPPRPPTAAPARGPAALAAVPSNAGECDRWTAGGSGSSNSVHSHSDDDSDAARARRIEFSFMAAGRCVEARLYGNVRLAPDERDVIDVPGGASAYVRERQSGSDRELTITGDGSGGVQRVYRANGVSAAYEAGGRAWFTAALPRILRDAGIGAPARVGRLRSEGGVSRVLAMIDSIETDHGQRAHFEALLSERGLTSNDIEAIVRSARRLLGSSSGDLAGVLARVPVQRGGSTAVNDALVDAAASITSDGDKTQLLTQLALAGDDDLLESVARAARGIESDGDKARFLMTTSASYLTKQRSTLVTDYFDALATMQSPGDRRNVLTLAASFGHADLRVTLAVIDAARDTKSDGDKAAVLMTLAGQRLVSSEAIRAAYLKAAGTIESEGDRARVLAAITPR